MTSTSDISDVDQGHQELVFGPTTPMTEIFSTVDVDFYSGEGGGRGGGGGGGGGGRRCGGDVFGHEEEVVLGCLMVVLVRGGEGGEGEDKQGRSLYVVVQRGRRGRY